jgi:FkbM family methyltransferase
MYIRARRVVSIVLTFKNAVILYCARLLHLKVREVQLWAGPRFEVANTNNNIGTLLEVFYEKEYADALTVHRQNPVIIDIGANIGAFTVWAGHMIPSATIYSFEPESTNFALLTHNIERNGLSQRATAVKSAVGGAEATRTLSIAGESSGKNSLSFDVGSGVTESVSCTTLDAIFSRFNIVSCDCLKVDCEGAEYELLYAASPETLKRIDMVILEWHRIAGHDVVELERFLTRHGFTVTRSARFASMLTARSGAA